MAVSFLAGFPKKWLSLVSTSVLLLMVCATAASTVSAQTAQAAPQNEQKPFIEPAEMGHEKAANLIIEAQPHQNGKWVTLPFMMPINPVHVALMHNGKVLVISGSGNDPNNKIFEAGVWDPTKDTVDTFRLNWDMFCNGMVVLPDGRPFVLGGTIKYDNFLGEPRTATFSPATAQFTDTAKMNGGRWYPTGTVLGDGSVLVVSGLNDTTGSVNTTVQIWKQNHWTDAGTIFAGVPLYPRQHLLPNGKVFESGANPNSPMFDITAHTWTTVATTKFGRPRDYGTLVILPLTPTNNYKPRVIILGVGVLRA